MRKRALFAVAAALLFYQVSTIGLANNGDFPRIAGRLSLCPEGGWDQNRFTYFVSVYRELPACHWDSEIPTSAMLLVRAARLLHTGTTFPIRYLGFLQAAILLGLLWHWPWAALLFLDVSYVAYFNSFYLEAASLLFLLATVAAALRRKAQWFLLAALLLVTCKTQHAMLAVPLSAYAFRAFRPWKASAAITALLLAAAAAMVHFTPLDYKASNLWNSAFVSLLPHDPAALAALHAGPEFLPFIGRNAYQFPDQATADLYIRAFYSRCGYRDLASYYLTHPVMAARRIAEAGSELRHVRPTYLGIYERGSARWWTYSWWSDLKSAAYRRVPWLVALVFAATIPLLSRSPHRALLVLLLAMAALEFTLSCFGDSTLDYRHNFLFHAITDIWLCFAANACCRSKTKLRGNLKLSRPAPSHGL